MLRLLPFDRFIALVICSLLYSHAMAQGFDGHRFVHLDEADTSLSSIQSRISGETDIQNIRFQLAHQKSSPMGQHEQYDLLVNNFPVYAGMVKRNVLINGTVTLSYPNFTEQQLNFGAQSKIIEQPNDGRGTKWIKRRLEWVWMENQWQIAWVIEKESDGDLIEVIQDTDGNELSRRSLSFNNIPDTTVIANVFYPDPITTARSEWGGDLMDNDDANSPALNAYLVEDSITARWDSVISEWKLESDFVKCVDVDAPHIDPPTSATADFIFGRGDSGFEYVNAYYHINRQQQHVQRLGFDNLANYPIMVDALAKNGQDQSTFYPSTGAERIEFGDGGVDDAEDADVIIHEYGHALSFSASPGTGIGMERLSIEEGMCDYMAISYSKAISDYQYDQVFNWDGHNEYWDGRALRPLATYPSFMEGLLYADGMIWATAMTDVLDYFGRDLADQLLFASLYNYYPHLTMPDAAHLIMQADSVLHNAEHSEELKIIFCLRGLYPGCADTLVSTAPLDQPYLGGTEDFIHSGNTIRIFTNQRSILQVQLFDLQGKLMYQLNREPLDKELFVELNLTSLPRGLFILRLTTNEGLYSFKLLKQYR